MGDTFNCGVVGYAQDITYIRLEPNKDNGPFWHQMLPWIRGRHFVWDLTHKEVQANLVVQDLALMGSMLQKKNVRLWLRGVSPDLARLLSNQKLPLPNVSCLDVDAPYFCSLCSSLRALTLNLDPTLHKELAQGTGFPKAPPCPTCKSEMRFNDIPRQYFSFLAQMQNSSSSFLDPASVNRAFNDAELNRVGGASHLDKKLWWSGNAQENGRGGNRGPTPVLLVVETGLTVALLVTMLALLGALLERLM